MSAGRRGNSVLMSSQLVLTSPRRRENPVDRGQVKTGVGCKYCDKVCLNEETLSIHVNNEHADRQSLFQCAFCGLRINDFSLYN